MPTSKPDALAALRTAAKKTRTVDVAALEAATAEDEAPLAGFLAHMAAEGLAFSHSYKSGKADAQDREYLVEFVAQLAEAGLEKVQEPNGALKQDAQDLLPWVLGVANGFLGNGLPAFDLVQEASLGLSEAIAAKLPAKDFARGARLWCEYRILAALLREPDWVVYPAAELALVDAYLRAVRELARDGVGDPSDEQVAGKMGKPEADAAKARAMADAQAKTGKPFKIVVD